MVLTRGAEHVLPQKVRTPHQPPEPQPDMASRFSNQWICLLQNILVDGNLFARMQNRSFNCFGNYFANIQNSLLQLSLGGLRFCVA